MNDTPETWHYGLVAEMWAEFNVETPELPFYEDVISRYGQPVLDVACGTGRMLLPLLQQGIDVDGCDISQDMLDKCREKVRREGLEANLYCLPMHALDLPRTYRTIYICGSFGLAGNRRLDMETLRAAYHHLEDGGALLFNKDVPYAYPDGWSYWLPERRKTLPEPWSPEGNRRLSSDGSEYVSQIRTVDLDPLEQHVVLEMHVQKWRDGQMVAEQKKTLRTGLYFRNELLMMLELAGFSDVAVYGDYEEGPVVAEHSDLVFVAQK